MVDDSRYSYLKILVGRYDLLFYINLSKAFELWLISNELLISNLPLMYSVSILLS